MGDDSEGEVIRAGERVKEFLSDPYVAAAISRLKERYFEAWKDENDGAKREGIHARARALDDLLLELAVTQDRGTVAKANRDRRDRPTGRR